MNPIRLILTGGFLGAGKTTLLARAAHALVRRGLRVGLITNDQAADLVDTEILRDAGFGVTEIAGGCFCCRFENLVESAEQLIAELQPDVLIGESVGSCTDLSATVIHPLKKLYADRFEVAPFSVLADPARLRESLLPDGEGRFPASVMYVFRKQLEEADLIVLNKADDLSPDERTELVAAATDRYGPAPLLLMSAATGEGVEEWLDHVLGDRPAGTRIAEVDYDTYAEGEAVLGWLNATVALQASADADWQAFVLTFLEALRSQLAARSAEIAHVKLRLTVDDQALVANLTTSEAEPSVRGSVGPGQAAHVTVNARVHTAPDSLRECVEASLASASGGHIHADVTRLHHFSPARPEPTHRMG